MALANITNNILTDSGVLVTNLTPTTRTLTINGTTYDLSADRSWTIATGVGGSGTTNYLPKFTGASTIGDSAVSDNGTTVTLNSRALKFSADTWNTSSDGLQRLYFSANSNTYLKGSGVIIRDNNDLNILTLATGGLATFSGTVNTPTKYTWGTATDGTTGQIATDNTNNYLDFKGNLYFRGAAASNTLMLLNASGNLSLGNTNDTYKLDVSGTARFTNSVTFAGGVYNFVGSNRFFAAASGSINYLYTGATNLTILNQGDTATLFTLANSGAATFSSSVTANNNITVLKAGSDTAFDGSYLGIGNANNTVTWGWQLGASNKLSLWYYNGGSTSNPLNVTSSGNVGIGTTSPQELLHVKAGASGLSSYDSRYKMMLESNGEAYYTVTVPDNSYAGLRILNSSAPKGAFEYYMTDDLLHIYSAGAARFYVGGGERMRITSGGSVLIGTTTEGFLGKLQVAGSVAITGQYNTVLPSSSFSYFDGSGQVVSSSSSASALYLDTTWNTTGNPEAIYLNVNNTASGSSSKLMNLKVDNVSQFQVTKAGAIKTGTPSLGSAQPWKLGEAVSGTLSTNYYIKVEINGQIYSIPALQGTP